MTEGPRPLSFVNHFTITIDSTWCGAVRNLYSLQTKVAGNVPCLFSVFAVAPRGVLALSHLGVSLESGSLPDLGCNRIERTCVV